MKVLINLLVILENFKYTAARRVSDRYWEGLKK